MDWALWVLGYRYHETGYLTYCQNCCGEDHSSPSPAVSTIQPKLELPSPSLEIEMAPLITFVYHHMGRLERDPNNVVKYSGGLVSDIEVVNPDTCNLSMVEEMILDLGYSSTKDVYWLVPGLGLVNGLRLLVTDEEVANMCDAAKDNGNMVHLYVEHLVIADPILIEQVVISDDTQEANAEFVKADDVVVDQPEKD
ncbi:hypothetical protein PIB30_033638 [Stylosanthes scabra]|uniref:PB1-like domain-containing protein n=1 Tax=Stylosanthes scabra TaxID=79078 RepID=A0ABU6SDB3_9FABA|nr:hypothetical protein [Stylosanthes scabra]